MNVLVLNCGSSTVKFQIIATDLDPIAQDTDERLARGQVERVGGEAIITFEAEGAEAAMVRTSASKTSAVKPSAPKADRARSATRSR